MVYKRFRVQVLTRVLVMCATFALACFLYYQRSFPIGTFICLSIGILQIAGLIYHVEKTRRELAHFLDSIRVQDFMDAAPRDLTSDEDGVGLIPKSIGDELRFAFARVIRDFQEVRMQREEQFHYVQTIVQHLRIGILTFDQNGHVELINSAAKRILRVNKLSNIADLEHFGRSFIENLKTLKPGDKIIQDLYDGRDRLQLSINATVFRRGGRQFTLTSIQDIHNELDEKEMEAWQNLMRVLTHEIRNSITPIISLASTAQEIIEAEFQDQEPDESMADVQLAVETIRNRSQGLLKFVEAFRGLYQIPKPIFEIKLVREIFAHLQVFFRTQFESRHIVAAFRVEPEMLELTADIELIEQVLINLILNAIAAVHETQKPRLEVTSYLNSKGRTVIKVADNGGGINEDIKDKIFIPFFSTKQDGSGIGLTLCRQIMRLHNGQIQVHSEPDGKTEFLLVF